MPALSLNRGGTLRKTKDKTVVRTKYAFQAFILILSYLMGKLIGMTMEMTNSVEPRCGPMDAGYDAALDKKITEIAQDSK